MLRCQCMKVILDNMEHNAYWDNKSKSYNTLTILKLIEKKYWIRPKINISMRKCTIKSVHCMDPINTNRLMDSITSDLILMIMLEKILL